MLALKKQPITETGRDPIYLRLFEPGEEPVPSQIELLHHLPLPRAAFFGIDPVNFHRVAAELDRLGIITDQFFPKEPYPAAGPYILDIVDLDFWVPEFPQQAIFLKMLAEEVRHQPTLVFGYGVDPHQGTTALGRRLLVVLRFDLNAVQSVLFGSGTWHCEEEEPWAA